MGAAMSCFGLLDAKENETVYDYESIPLHQRREGAREKEREVDSKTGQMASFIGL